MNNESTENPTLDKPFDDPMAEALADNATEAETRRMEAIYAKVRTARDKLNVVVDDLGVKAHEVEKVARENLGQTEEKIKEHPFAAVGIAASVGLVVGLLLNRRH